MPICTNSVIANGPFLFISGQTPMDNDFIPENILEQTKIVLKKIQQVLTEESLDFSNAVKLNVFITDASYLGEVREAFTEILGESKPAMNLVVVKELVQAQFKVKIDATASFSRGNSQLNS